MSVMQSWQSSKAREIWDSKLFACLVGTAQRERQKSFRPCAGENHRTPSLLKFLAAEALPAAIPYVFMGPRTNEKYTGT